MIRALFIIFIISFSLFGAGESRGFTLTCDSKGIYIFQSCSDQLPQRKLEHCGMEFHLVKHNNMSDKREDFLSIDDEDEDQVCLRKQIVVTKSFAALAQTFAFDLLRLHPKNRLPFCSHLSYISSYKYILQRVLRI